MTERPKYIDIPFHEARKVKWEAGIAEHRKGDAEAAFHGEPCEEAYQECLDKYNLLVKIDEQYGCDTSQIRAECESHALAIQRILRVYPRNHHR